MKTYSKFNTDKRGNQVALTVTRGSGHEIDGQAIIYEGDTLVFSMSNPKMFVDFFECETLAQVLEMAIVSGWEYYENKMSPLYTGEWK